MSPSEQKELAAFPAPLRALVEAELQAGNTVAEWGHGFPAAPCGAYIRLARPVGTRPRKSADGLDFYERNSSSYSGEFTDAKRHFFVLEPPHPPEPPPDMDAIRARMNTPGSTPSVSTRSSRPQSDKASRRSLRVEARTQAQAQTAAASSLVARFAASMEIDYEKWHDGIGYDLALLKQATPEDLKSIETLLIHQGRRDWRDVEALSVLATPGARRALLEALQDPDPQVRLAVHHYAPELLSESVRTDSLVRALETAEVFGGLTQALDEVTSFHPPPVIDALLRGLMTRDGGTAVHYAAMLYFLYGKASVPFDWAHRPFFLRFKTEDRTEREAVTRELCRTLAIDPRRCGCASV